MNIPIMDDLKELCKKLEVLREAIEPMSKEEFPQCEKYKEVFDSREVFSDWIEVIFDNLKTMEHGFCSEDENHRNRAFVTLGVTLQTVNEVRNMLSEIAEEEDEE